MTTSYALREWRRQLADANAKIELLEAALTAAEGTADRLTHTFPKLEGQSWREHWMAEAKETLEE